MRIGTVIGRVTLSKTVEELRGARWLIVSPFAREDFQKSGSPPLVTKEPSVVVYDDLGGGVGQTIGFIEGREPRCRLTARPQSTPSTPPWWTRFFSRH